MSTVESRLNAYYDFDEDVVAATANVAERQASMGWQEFLADCGVVQPEHTVFENKATEFVEFRPKDDFDETKARVFHAPMANPMDPNIAYQAATVFAADPTTRLFAVANPSGPGRHAGLLDRMARSTVARGDLTPTIEPTLWLLKEEGITTVTHIGGSYGAEKSMVAAAQASRFDQEVTTVVAIEPPSVKERSLTELAPAFMAINAHLDEYVRASDSAAFIAAREKSVGALGFSLGLVRFTNIAVAKALAYGSFEQRSVDALSSNAEMKATISWGTESELAIHGLIDDISSRLCGRFGDTRVHAMPLPGQHHALGNDIYLQAALALQGSRI